MYNVQYYTILYLLYVMVGILLSCGKHLLDSFISQRWEGWAIELA